jgi:hypothetical protein
MELLLIISVVLDATDKQLLRFYAFVRYWENT